MAKKNFNKNYTFSWPLLFHFIFQSLSSFSCCSCLCVCVCLHIKIVIDRIYLLQHIIRVKFLVKRWYATSTMLFPLGNCNGMLEYLWFVTNIFDNIFHKYFKVNQITVPATIYKCTRNIDGIVEKYEVNHNWPNSNRTCLFSVFISLLSWSFPL